MTAGGRPIVVETRPGAATPRPYEFPPFERHRLPNGLEVLVVEMPGRPLVTASLVLRHGAADEPADVGGASVLAARALAEGTEERDAVAFIEAAERLGAAIHAEAGWDAMSASVDVPAARLEPALELVAEMLARPTFPAGEVDRLREERLNDLLQARADPRRRADEAFAATVFTPRSPYHRPAGGVRETVEKLGRDVLRAVLARGFDPARMTLVVAGDLRSIDVPRVALSLFGGWATAPGAVPVGPITAESAVGRRFVRVVHRPGAVQTEIRIGHPGLPRRTPDFHAVSVMSSILGGLFNSRLNMKLREEKGYTYGAGAGFDMRRAAGPFSARAAVNTEATVPAITDFLAEIGRMQQDRVTDTELRAARDFLVGVFPLRFETPGPVVGALSGIAVHGLPDDELTRYRPAIEAVDAEAVLNVAQRHIDLDRAAIVLVGDVEAFGAELEAAGFGPVVIERDEGPQTEGPAEGVEDELGPVDRGPVGPTEGAEDAPTDAAEEPADAEDGRGGGAA
jgi:predicted Zn-dependent peptidase